MQIEQHLLFLINREWTNPAMDWLMAILTNWSFWMPIVFGVALLVGIFGNFRIRMALFCAVFSVGVVDGIVVDRMKHIFKRPRPYMVLQDVREVELARVKPRLFALTKPLEIAYSHPSFEQPVYGPSFPSAHAANNFAVATVFLLFFRRWGWILFISAALVSYSRVYVGSHWPLDILAASLIGVSTALFLTACVAVAWKRWGPRLFPRLSTAYPSLLTPSPRVSNIP